MSEILFCDYAWSKPSPGAIKRAGFTGVLRYFSHDPSKDLTATEVTALHKVGLSVGIVWETTATEATAGHAAGAADAKEATRRAISLGYPHGAALFFAVDEDADPKTVLPYFQGVDSACGFPVGVYGSKRVVEGVLAAGYAKYGWQTEAWSGTAISSKAHFYQRVKPTKTIVGAKSGSWDEDVQLKPVPLWTAAAPKPAVTPKPKPAPDPAPAPTTQVPTAAWTGLAAWMRRWRNVFNGGK